MIRIATLTLTTTAGGYAGSQLRHLAMVLVQVANTLPDSNSTGASTVVTLDNGVGYCGVQVTGGPYAGSQVVA